ncbi:6-hydroxymethylpterin diphosphokinase MptE-like protein [Neobacillus sp.]|uniref:motility associated factor glycosyltransferase family protein n=1 Tax=Neobacillus sp. TaxID=2675273 RepID=UPI0028982DB9|nr:6-hydroxymethylpterin diphosphokinase MptE-like protein [Neobacillus sp.]
MILIENRNFLRIHNRPLMEKISKCEAGSNKQSLILENSKKGLPTLKLNINEKTLYLHSKYDPVTEAERLIIQLKEMDKYKHILFIGVGLGYHIKAMLSEYPEMKFSIFEPNLDVLCEFLTQLNLNELPINQLVTIFSTTNEQELRSEVSSLNSLLKEQTYIFILPVYKNLFDAEIQIVMESLVNVLKEKRSNLAVDASFQKRWTINSIKNFPKILQTPNILRDIDDKVFKGKPAIIVAAGPSLNEELKNLKYIKEHGLAYIFSVGSAINALIEQGIFPDAACTYDPTNKNQIVFEKLKERNIADIPLIFGSSVGFETLENYPGILVHMLTNQDTISPYYLNDYKNIDVIQDAPSIAVITFELLIKLGCKQIIFVGQNLAYQNDNRYAQGINYDFVSNQLSEQEKKELFTVKDVYGDDVQTDEDFLRMRQQLEMYISQYRNIEVINTTKGGAKIGGTNFLPLSEVISEKLIEPNIVTPHWFIFKNSYDMTYTMRQIEKMKLAKISLEKSLQNVLNELHKIEASANLKKTKELEKRFNYLDKEFELICNNAFFKAFVQPMVRVQNQHLTEETQAIRFERDVIRKGHVIAQIFESFIMDCRGHLRLMIPFEEEMNERIKTLYKQNEKG